MSVLKLHRTKIGSFTVDSLGKPAPQRVLSRKERQAMQELHDKVQLWARENFNDERRQNFYRALNAKDYKSAYDMLMEAFYANQRITIWRMRSWQRWFENFHRGFTPS